MCWGETVVEGEGLQVADDIACVFETAPRADTPVSLAAAKRKTKPAAHPRRSIRKRLGLPVGFFLIPKHFPDCMALR